MRWLSPHGAIDAFTRGEISLRNPTVQNLKLCEGAVGEGGARARSTRRDVPTIRPRVIMEGDKRRVLMPGDPATTDVGPTRLGERVRGRRAGARR